MTSDAISQSCPVLSSGNAGSVTLAHGEGGRAAREFLKHCVFGKAGLGLNNDFHDAAHLSAESEHLAFCTDSFIVSPLFFPGGDIGSLAVHGTCNDLVVAGARPRWISLSMILEEGLETELLERVLKSAARAAREIGVEIVTGDTKVAPKGAVDQLFLTTSGIGEMIPPLPTGPATITVGDVLLVSGPVGQHGAAILCSRENIALDPIPTSDVGSLFPAVQALRAAHVRWRALRDSTRGGVAAILHEWAEACGHTLVLREAALPVTSEVRGTCELLGLDPLFLACEGAMVVAVPEEEKDTAVVALRSLTTSAAILGHVEKRGIVPVIREGVTGRRRTLDEPLMPSMPRIC